MPVEKDRRRHRRIACINPIRISWEEHGQPQFAPSKCIDISESGLRIESSYPVKPGTLIVLTSERIKLTGAATVRHVIRRGNKYLLGLQLTQALLGSILAELESKPAVTALIENLDRTH